MQPPNQARKGEGEMTRANINYVWQEMGKAPHTLFFYWNGDQYPQGIRDCYHILDFVKLEEWTPQAFKNWAKKNYKKVKIEDLGIAGQPKIYYTDGFITDYSYVFEQNRKEILVWNWDNRIFRGNPKKFEKWLLKQK